ncbi:MAG: hypothetical protein ABL967_20260 [Bryobacteraceae bacterium]
MASTVTAQKSIDYVGIGLAGLTALLAFVVVAGHVYLASIGKADTVTTLLLNLLALTFSTIFTVWLGRWSAHRENKAFIRAALRTTYGLHEGLEAAERSALEGIARMKGRTSLPQAAEAEMWEEVFGRVLDQVRGQMRRAQETVANWREFLPEEVDKLNQAEEQKASAISEVTIAADQARALLRELGDAPESPDTLALRARIEALEQEKSRITASSALAMPAAGEARKLLAMGALEEAIAAYSSLIEASPSSHSPYLARARARYLAGDASGAMADLKAAEEKCPTDPTIARMRAEIQAGRKVAPVPTIAMAQAWKAAVDRGNRALAAGKGEDAVREYRAAREAGLLPVFAAQNEAMALLTLGKPSDARTVIQAAIGSMTGPFVRVQGLALLAVADALEGRMDPEAARHLASALDDLRLMGKPFSMADSSLQFLLQGLRSSDRFEGSVRDVFLRLLPQMPGEA